MAKYFDAAKSERPEQGQSPAEWVELQVVALRVPLSQVARDADIDRSTLFRLMRRNSQPYLGTFERVRSTIRSYWTRIERETA